MQFSPLARFAVTGASVFSLVALVVACDGNGRDWADDGYGDGNYNRQSQCSNVVQQCQTVCDSYQCYPQCQNVCADDSDASTVTIDGGDVVYTDGGITPVLDASPPPVIGDAGTGVLCSACISNTDCETGSLCILRGGQRDGGSGANGFCSTACSTQADCPDSFLCEQIGSSRQCVPTGNACN